MHERMLDKTSQPTDEQMIQFIGSPLSATWTALRLFLVESYGIHPVIDSGGKKYGWNLQYRIGGRPLCEMFPEKDSFTVLVILGKAELEQAMQRLDSFGATVQKYLQESSRYHDGCWMYIRVADPQVCLRDEKDIEQLIQIKKKPPK